MHWLLAILRQPVRIFFIIAATMQLTITVFVHWADVPGSFVFIYLYLFVVWFCHLMRSQWVLESGSNGWCNRHISDWSWATGAQDSQGIFWATQAAIHQERSLFHTSEWFECSGCKQPSFQLEGNVGCFDHLRWGQIPVCLCFVFVVFPQMFATLPFNLWFVWIGFAL